MSTEPMRFAYCRLLLRGGHWVPIGVDAPLKAEHRSKDGGPVVTAFLTAIVSGTRLLGWPEKQNSQPFTMQQVLPDGSVEEPDYSAVMAQVSAGDQDEEAKRAGAVGINQVLARRKLAAEAAGIPKELKDAAFDRAATQILDKLHGQRAQGVFLGQVRE
jgi:hypothetical protein